jgi:hypothetical protein
MPSIGQTWDLASIGAVVEMGILSTLKRLLMESTKPLVQVEVSFLPFGLHFSSTWAVLVIKPKQPVRYQFLKIKLE